jgi:hypothetical protein
MTMTIPMMDMYERKRLELEKQANRFVFCGKCCFRCWGEVSHSICDKHMSSALHQCTIVVECHFCVIRAA